MDGQTRIHPCEFCREASVEEVELTPAVTKTVNGTTVEVKPAHMVHACALHAQHVKDGRGWQERMKDTQRRLTREAKARLKRDQLGLLG